MVASIMGSNEKEWRDLATMCDQAGVDLIEGNFSCPQMTSHDMGSDVGTNPELVKKYSKAVSEMTKIPFIAKMTPNNKNMEEPARAAIEGGAASVSAINTIKSITNIDFENMTAMPVVNGKSSISGYSGAAVKPIALRFLTQLFQNPVLKNLEISGMGGIETWRDCAEFLAIGCRNLQVTTAIMQYGYRIVEDMASGLIHFMMREDMTRLRISSVLRFLISFLRKISIVISKSSLISMIRSAWAAADAMYLALMPPIRLSTGMRRRDARFSMRTNVWAAISA